jgi:hypothetical protein
MGRLFAFMCVSSFSVALVICWARAIIRDVDCSGAVSVLAGFVAVPFVSPSFWRRADRAEKERRFCFLASASALDGELEWKKELNLNLDMLKLAV